MRDDYRPVLIIPYLLTQVYNVKQLCLNTAIFQTLPRNHQLLLRSTATGRRLIGDNLLLISALLTYNQGWCALSDLPIHTASDWQPCSMAGGEWLHTYRREQIHIPIIVRAAVTAAKTNKLEIPQIVMTTRPRGQKRKDHQVGCRSRLSLSAVTSPLLFFVVYPNPMWHVISVSYRIGNRWCSALVERFNSFAVWISNAPNSKAIHMQRLP